MTMRLKCPNPSCGRTLKVAEQFAGRMGICSGCGTQFRIPMLGSQAPDPNVAPALGPSLPATTQPQPAGRPAVVQHPGEFEFTLEPAGHEILDKSGTERKADRLSAASPAEPAEVAAANAGYEVLDNQEPGQEADWFSAAPPIRPGEAKAEPALEQREQDRPERPAKKPPLSLSKYYRPKRPSRRSRHAWGLVKIGLTLMTIASSARAVGVCLLAIGIIGSLLTAGSMEASGRPPAGASVAFIGLFVIMILIGVWLLAIQIVPDLIGYGFCMAAPPKRGVKGLAIASLALALAALLLQGAYLLIVVIGSGSGATPLKMSPLGLVANLFSLAQFIVALCFLRALGLVLKDDDLVDGVHRLLMFVGGAVALGILLGVLLGFGAVSVVQSGQAGTGTLSFMRALFWTLVVIMLICSVAISCWYALLVFRARGIVSDEVG